MIIILEDLEFGWKQCQIDKAIELWGKGLHIKDIARMLQPKKPMSTREDETALLIMHLSRQGLIKNRKTGVMGRG